VVLLEILQTDFEVELTSTGNDVLTRLVDEGQDTGVGLGQTLKTFDKLGQITSVLDLDGALNDWRDGELHDLEVVGSLGSGESTRLEQELVNTDKTDNVTSRNILDGLGTTAHHENGTLNVLDEQVVLLARGVVGTLDADLETGADGTSVDTAESVETTLVGGGNHLGDVKHKRSAGITVTDTNASLVISGTLVQSLGTVLLGSDGRGQVDTDHLQHGIGGGQELAHDSLEELLANEVLLIGSKLDINLLKKGGDLVLLVVVDELEDLEDGVENKHVESTLDGLAIDLGLGLGPLLGLGVEIVITPETLEHLLAVDTELLGELDGELADSESPAVKTGTESNGTAVRVDLDVTERLVLVGSDDDVDGLDGTSERLVQIFLGDLEFEKGTVDLVDDEDGFDTLSQSLAEHSLGLDANTGDAVDDDESTIGDTESSSNFRGEINVTGGINQVDQELRAVDGLGNFLEILLIGELGVQGDGSGLDGNTTLLLVGTGVHETGITSPSSGNNTGTLDQRVTEGGLSVIDVSNDRHVTDVGLAVHQAAELFDSEVDHFGGFFFVKAFEAGFVWKKRGKERGKRKSRETTHRGSGSRASSTPDNDLG
jgi:hypothetical protein